MKKVETTEKKVYKTNTKLIKRITIIMIVAIVIGIFFGPLLNGARYLYLKTWKSIEIEEYDLTLDVPKAYKAFEELPKTSLEIDSSAFITDSSIEVDEEYVLKKADTVYSAGNILNGVSLMLQCLNTPKTDKTLEEIANNYHVMVTIYYEDNYKIGDLKKEFVNVLDNEAVRTDINLTNKKDEIKTLVTYLVPLDEKEVTITFLGSKENIQNAAKEIEEIVSRIK